MRSAPMPSSVIRAWEYDAAAQRLRIEFISGRHYLYHQVPEAIACGLRRAVSKGSFFNRRIRDQFRFTQESD